MGESYGGLPPGASAEALTRFLAGLRGSSAWPASPASAESFGLLERRPAAVVDADPLEEVAEGGLAVPGVPEPGFAAFLDGIQRSVVLPGGPHGVPLVCGTVAAAIRRRRDDRALETWGGGALVRHSLYAPVARADRGVLGQAGAAGLDVVDTAAEGAHPHEVLAAALDAIHRARGAIEAELATRWCARETALLYVDGGIAGLGEPASNDRAVGVVKSHRTAYGGLAAMNAVFAMAPGQRTHAFTVEGRGRASVASWYLRLHPGDGTDPFGGIVRVEVASGAFTSVRADSVSRWILAERSPVALPDPRWRVMPYGIRAVEEYLRAAVPR